MERAVIGGEFELRALALGPINRLAELTGGVDGTWTASGRAALAILLQGLKANGVRHVHLPAYLCKSLLLTVQALGLNYSFYPVGVDWTARPDPPRNAAVLLIHYFGWLNPATTALRAEAGRTFHLIEDVSHALLSNWHTSSNKPGAVFFSARKFAPTALGGWCSVASSLPTSSVELEALLWRSLAGRFVRGAYLSERRASPDPLTEEFYQAAFQAVESFMDKHPLNAAVPSLVLELIAGINWPKVAVRRRDNWKRLDQLLGNTANNRSLSLSKTVVPLGYVARFRKRDKVRKHLAAKRIFCPIHWTLPREVSRKGFPEAAALSESCLTLPVDQRYGAAEMERIARLLKSSGV